MKRKAVGALQVGKVFRNLLTMILDDLSDHKDAMIMLTNIHTMDDYLYQHSLNVCIYSTMLGMAHGYSREELMTLGLGSSAARYRQDSDPYTASAQERKTDR